MSRFEWPLVNSTGVRSMIWKERRSWPRTNHLECNGGPINGKPAVHFHCIEEPVLHYSTATFPPGILTKATRSGGHCREARDPKREREKISRSPHTSYEICTDAVDFVSRKGGLLAGREWKEGKVVDGMLGRDKSWQLLPGHLCFR